MNSEKRARQGQKAGNEGCRVPEDFQGMFEMMKKCCMGRGVPPDCADMMKEMKETCCPSDRKPQTEGG